MVVAIKKILETLKVDAIILLGDAISTCALGALRDAETFICRLRMYAPVYFIIGNHERRDNDEFQTDLHPFHALGHVPDVNVIERAEIHNICGHTFLFLPYVPPGRMVEAMGTVENIDDAMRRCTAVFSHITVTGANVDGAGNIKNVKADDWPIDAPLLLSGHIHKYHWPQANVGYVGTPYQINDGEDTNKAIMHVRFQGDDPEIALPSTKHFQHLMATRFSYSRLPLGVPARKTVYLTAETFADYAYVPDNAVGSTRIIITARKADIDLIHTHSQYKQLARTPGVQIKHKYTSVFSQEEADPSLTFLERLRARVAGTNEEAMLVDLFM